MRGCAVTASYPEVRSDHRHANSFRTAPSLCADMIFGNDRPFREVFIRAKFQARVKREVFRPKSRVSPRCVTAGRTLERRHCLPGLHQHRVEVTAASALPSDLHRQLDDRGGDLRQCLNALCPEFRFGHGGLSRFGFERCHGSSGAVRTVCSARRSSPCTVPGGEGLIDGR